MGKKIFTLFYSIIFFTSQLQCCFGNTFFNFFKRDSKESSYKEKLHATEVVFTDCVITNSKGGGLGDHFRNYFRAKWVAYIYDIPFVLTPFKYSEMFALDDLEINRFQVIESWDKAKKITLPLQDENKTLFLSPSWFVSKEEYLKIYGFSLIDDLVKQKEFCETLKQLIQLKAPIGTFYPDKSIPSVACHIRRPSRGDAALKAKQFHEYSEDEISAFQEFDPNPKLPGFPYSFPSQNYPDKFPSLQYYVNEIKWLYKHLGRNPLCVHIFTDDKFPEKLTRTIQEKVGVEEVIFSFTSGNDVASISLLVDFFSMMNFDYLIRSNSNFSLAPMLIGDYKMVIYPRAFAWENETLIVKEIEHFSP